MTSQGYFEGTIGIMLQIGKIIIFVGLTLLFMGGIVYLAGKLNLPIGRLPGDIQITQGNLTCLIPLATSLVISVLLTIGLNLLTRWLNR